MKLLKNAVFFSLFALVCSMMSGCYAMIEFSCKNLPDGTLSDCGFKPRGGPGGGPHPQLAAITNASGSVDLSTLYLDTTGTTYTLPASGTATITIYDANNAVLAANTFPTVRNGARITFQNNTTVENWLNQYQSTGASFDSIVSAGTPPIGTSTLSGAWYYSGTQQAAGSSTVTNCPRGASPHLCVPNN